MTYHPLEEKKEKERNDGPIIASDVRGKCPGGGWGLASLAESCTFLGFNILKCVPFWQAWMGFSFSCSARPACLQVRPVLSRIHGNIIVISVVFSVWKEWVSEGELALDLDNRQEIQVTKEWFFSQFDLTSIDGNTSYMLKLDIYSIWLQNTRLFFPLSLMLSPNCPYIHVYLFIKQNACLSWSFIR